jgi:hypothetical protein
MLRVPRYVRARLSGPFQNAYPGKLQGPKNGPFSQGPSGSCKLIHQAHVHGLSATESFIQNTDLGYAFRAWANDNKRGVTNKKVISNHCEDFEL